MNDQPLWSGSCHCGAIRVALRTALRCADLQPRACDCSFCVQHGAAWVSDPAGSLALECSDRTALHPYRQGSGQALFLWCGRCGVLLAAMHEDGTRQYGAVNARCLDRYGELGAAQVVSPQRLSADEKVRRWARIWTPVTRIG